MGRRPGERGSAVVEAVLVIALLTMLFVGVLQLGLALHVRNVVMHAASEGARYGGIVGRGPEDAVERTAGLIDGALPGRYAVDVSAQGHEVEGVAMVIVTVRAPVPVIGLAGPNRLTATGRAIDEREWRP